MLKKVVAYPPPRAADKLWHFCSALFKHGITLLAVFLMALRIAGADVVYINQKEEAAVGTYHYPLSKNGQFTPGYYFVPAEADVAFTLIAQDGATLHIFDDAAGTNELAVPVDLRTAGQAQSSSDGSNYHQGTVHLAQGWHKLYLDYTLLSLREDTNDCYCSLNFSVGQMYDQPQAVSASLNLGDWTGTATFSSTGTLTFTQANGVTPAAGDNLTWAIAKITMNPEGNNPVPVNYASVSGDATTDANGVANVVLTWQNPNPLNSVLLLRFSHRPLPTRPNRACGFISGAAFPAIHQHWHTACRLYVPFAGSRCAG